MAQAGRLYPRSTYQDISLPPGDLNRIYPPRKIRIAYFDGLGSLTTKWIGLEVISEVAQRTGNFLTYEFIHPTASDALFKMLIGVGNVVVGATGFSTLYYGAEYWESGTRWGRWKWPLDQTAQIFYFHQGSLNFATFSQFSWVDLVDPIQFSAMGSAVNGMRAWSATWEENQPYQPYRTRP